MSATEFVSGGIVTALFWSVATVAFYVLARMMHKRVRKWWMSPLIVAPASLLILALALRVTYQHYIQGTHWLMLMLGPVTVAFAIPIYEHRMIIRRNWKGLAVGVVSGSGLAMFSAWLLARALNLSPSMTMSLLPRSVSTPFAMAVSGDIGGVPDLTAVFVILTGIFGASFGDAMLAWLPLRSHVARGALFGMGAHAAGVARAHQIGNEEGCIAGLVMVLAGLFNVLAAPLLAYCLR